MLMSFYLCVSLEEEEEQEEEEEEEEERCESHFRFSSSDSYRVSCPVLLSKSLAFSTILVL